MTTDRRDESKDTRDESEVFRYGGAGTLLLLALLAFIGLHPLMLGGFAARATGVVIITVILIAGTMASSRSKIQRAISIMLAVALFCLQLVWLATGHLTVEAWVMALFAAFCLSTGIVMLRHVLGFGPLYADRVHAALCVYILLALAWAGAYAVIEILSPGAFVLQGSGEQLKPQGMFLLADMIHFSVATLTSTGYGDLMAVAPFARSLSQLEQLLGVFYIAVLISRLVGLYPAKDRV